MSKSLEDQNIVIVMMFILMISVDIIKVDRRIGNIMITAITIALIFIIMVSF